MDRRTARRSRGSLLLIQKTNSLDPHQADLVGISLCSKIGKACYIPVGHKSQKCLNKESVVNKLKNLLETPVLKNWSKY